MTEWSRDLRYQVQQPYPRHESNGEPEYFGFFGLGDFGTRLLVVVLAGACTFGYLAYRFL